MFNSITDPKIRRLVQRYVDLHIDHISERTYASLVQVDPNTDFKKLRERVSHDFGYFYNMAWRVAAVLGTDTCEAETARCTLKALEKNAIFLYSRGLEMQTQ